MEKKLVIFDLDGVLFDSPKLVSEHFLNSFPTMTKETLDEILCGNFHEELEKAKLVHKLKEETSEEKEERTRAYSTKKLRTPLYDGIKDLLEKLHKAGDILTINTSAFGKNCLPLLEYTGLASKFDFVATKEISNSKVEKFKIIKEKYSDVSKKILFITDTLGDVREADIAGIPTVAVTYGAHNRSYFIREPHKNLIAILDSVAELQNFILSY